jgi:hypothetical protein
MECSNFIFGILSIIVHELPFVVEKQSKAILVDNISNMAHSFYIYVRHLEPEHILANLFRSFDLLALKDLLFIWLFKL